VLAAVLVVLCCDAHGVLAQDVDRDIDLDRARVLSTDLYAPAVAFEYRGGTRARFGAVIPAIDRDDSEGFALTIEPFFELAEPRGSPQFLPSQYWRARAIVETSYGIQDGADSYRLFVGIEHESDHETAHPYSTPGILALNGVAMGGRSTLAVGGMRFSTFATLRGYVLSCTRNRLECENLQGSASVGGQLDMVLSVPALTFMDLEPYLSGSVFGIAPNEKIQREGHGEVRMGFWHMTRSLLLQVFVTAYAGNDVGITRTETIALIGAGTSFAFVP
jgi:hypothetical protein